MNSPMGRLWTTIRPIRARLFLGLLSALTASIVALLIPQVLQRLVDRLEADPTRTAVLTAGAAVLALGLVEASLIWLRRTFAVAPATTAEKQMRVRFYDKVQRMPVAFHDAWGSGQLLSRSMSDINQIRRWVAFGMIMVVTSSVTILVGVALLVRASPLLAGVFLLGAAPVTAISYRFSRRYHALSRLSQDQSGDLATTIEQSVQGIRVLKAFGRGPTALDVFTGQADELRRTEVRKATAMASFTAAIFALPELALGVALYLGLHGVAAGTMDVGRLAAYFATATLVIGPTRMLGQLLGQAVNTTTALERHYEVMDEPDTITSPDHPVPVDGESACGDVRFENVRFRYPDAPTRGGDLLDGVDLHVRPGETMALVGLTGSGKSTLLQLVPRLYDVTGGRITVDGVDVREMGLTDLRRLTAVAFEDATLFSDSVRANVLLGADPGLDPEESDDLLHLALRTADAGFTLDLPDGVETRIGEQGLSLSGGQRQRLALARAIAARPRVLLLDDPLSALDTRTEETVTARLREVLSGTTTLVVAHRTSTVALADRVALLDGGRIVAVGTHADLMATSARYRYVLTDQQREAAHNRDITELTDTTTTTATTATPRGRLSVLEQPGGTTTSAPTAETGAVTTSVATADPPPTGEDDRTLTADENRAARRRSSRLLGELLRPVRGRIGVLGVMVVLAQLAVVAGPAIIAWGIDHALPALLAGDPVPTVLAAVALLLAAVVGGALTFGYVRQSTVIGQDVLLSLRRRVFRQTQRQDLEFHERYTSGRIVSRQTSDMEALRELLDSGIDVMVGSSLSMLFTIALILAMDPVTGAVMLLMLVPGVALTVWFQRRSREAYRGIRTHSARLIVQFVEAMTGIRAVKAFRKEDADLARYDTLAQNYRDASLASIMIFGIYQPALRILANATIAVVLVVGGFRVLSGDLQVGVLVALVIYARRFFQPIDEIANFYNSFQSAVAALEKIAALLAEVPAVRDPEDPTPLPRARGEIDLVDAAFRYTPRGPLVLHPLDLHIPAGQTVALVGRTGAGKSTIAKLVARFYDVTRGSVRLDGIDVRNLTAEDLTRSVVMVTQEAYLFSGSVAQNIAVGRPGASRADIEDAADAIGAGEFIRRLPDGFDTDVNTRGGRVSAGQRQLISFARAFLADPAVLILDEATSSLDIPSERAVQEGLTQLLGARTALIIAHRLSTVMIADRVLVVDDGRVVEDGSPADLIAAGGRFAALYHAWQAA